MIHDTKQRLIDAASQLFAANGYSGASVRDICDLARSNPGAVSYHFGGKRQLYRTVLRHAVDRLALAGSAGGPDETDEPPDVAQVALAVFQRLELDPVATRLLLRDLADGGSLAVEALEPRLRSAVDGLRTHLGSTDSDRTTSEVRTLFLELAAPVFLLSAGWPALARPLELAETDRRAIVEALVEKSLRR